MRMPLVVATLALAGPLGSILLAETGAEPGAGAGVALGGAVGAQNTSPQNVAAAMASRGSSPTIAQFIKVRVPGSVALLPTGEMLVRDWPNGVFQLYRSATATPDGLDSATPLTAYKDGLSGYTLSPDGTKLLLMFASGGNENTQIALADPKAAPTAEGTLATSPIVNNPKVQSSPNTWFEDSSGFLYSANETSPSDFHLYRYDFAADGGKGGATKILAKEGSWSASDTTKDKSRALVAQFRSASDSTVHELDIATGALTELTIKGSAATASCVPVGYMPGDAAVLMLSDADGDLQRLLMRDLKSGAITEPVPALSKFEIDGVSMNDTKTMVVVTTNEDGYAVPHAFALPGFTPIALPRELEELGKGIFSAGQFRGNTLVWSLTNARNPGQTYATTWNSDGTVKGTVQLTRADTQGIDFSTFTLPKLIKYSSFDGLEIPAFLYLPADFKQGTPIPFVVNYHGGPESQFRPGFDRTIQYLVSKGFGVIQPNVRGSSGYGRNFLMMDDYTKRWDSVKDGLEAARWLVREGYAKAGHIATWGGSYGGYMVNATAVADGESSQPVLGAGITIVGIVNLETFLQQTAGYRRKLREAEYGPLSDPNFLKSVSPIHRADSIRMPMMIVHGLNDPRVPVGEAMQLAVSLQTRALTNPALEPELLYFADEGHGLAKLNNRLLFAERMVAFLNKHIGMR